MQQDNAEHKSLKKRLSEQEEELISLRKKEKEYLERISALRKKISRLTSEKSKLHEDAQENVEKIILFDEHLTPVFASPSVLLILGCSLDQLKSNTIYTYLHKDDYDVLLDIKTSFAGSKKGTYIRNFRLKHTDGKYIKIESTFSLITDQKTDFRIILSSNKIKNTDISISSALQKNLGFGQKSLGSEEMVSLFRNNQLCYITHSVETILGYSQKEFLSLNHFDLFHPDEKETLVQIIKKRIHVNSREKFRYVYRQQHKNGTYVWLESTVVIKKTFKNHVNSMVFTSRIPDSIAESIHLKSANQKLKAFKLIRKEILVASNETKYIKNVLEIIHDVIGYQSVLLHSFVGNTRKNIYFSEDEGNVLGSVQSGNDVWNKFFTKGAPGGATLFTGETQVLNIKDIEHGPWTDHFVNAKIKEICIIPVIVSREINGIVSLLSTKENTFTVQEISYLLEISDDIGHGISNIRNKRNKKDTEKQLRVNEEKYRNLFNFAPLGFFRSTADGRFIELNFTMAQMLGYDTPEEVMANVTDISGQLYTEPEKRRKIIDYCKKNPSVHQFENTYRKLDGSVFIANLYLRVVSDKQGDIDYLEGMLEDITFRKATEQTIKENQERLTKLNAILNETESLTDIGGFEWNVKEDILILSQGWQQMYGFYENNIPFERVKKLAHPDDLNHILNSVDKALSGKEDFHMEYRIIRYDDKRVRHLKARSKVIFNAANEPVKMYGSVQDVTEYKRSLEALAESEQKYRFLADSTSELICLHDVDGKYLHVSPSVKKMLGYEMDELEGTNPYDLFHPDDRNKIRQDSHKKALDGQPVAGMEYRIKKKDGSYCWFDTYTDLIFDHQGKVKSLITRSRDITEKIKYQQQLKASKENLKIALNVAIADPWEFNLVTKELTYSEEWINRLGYSTKELSFAIDKISNIIHEDDLKKSLKKLQDHIDGKTPYYESEARIKKKNGQLFWILSRGTVVERDKNNNPVLIRGINFDITKQKNAEKALLESEERFRAAFEQDNSIKFIIDAQSGKILQANQAASKFYGYQLKELEGKTIYDINILSKEDIEKEMNLASLKNKNRFYFKHQLKSKEIRDVVVYSTPIEYGGKKRLFSIIYDVTDQLQAEQALKISEERLKQAEAAGKLGHYEINIATGQSNWSDEVYRIFDYRRDEITPDIEFFRKSLHPDDREKVMDLFMECTREHKEFNLEYRIFQKSGNIRYVHSKGYLKYDENGEPVSMFGTFQDITEKWLVQQAIAESEEKYRKLITGMNDGVVLHDHDGQIISNNPAALSILNVTEDELKTISNNNELTFLHEDGSSFPVNEHPAYITLQTGKPLKNVIMGIQKKGNLVTWISINSQPLRLSNSDNPFAMVTFSDITMLKTTENQLQDLNATKDKLLSIIAHDLMNPFNSLLGFSKLLRDHVKKENYDKLDYFSNLIYQSAQQGHILLKNLLDWSRSQTGKISFKPENIVVSDLILEVYNLHHFIAERKNIVLEYISDKDVNVFADANMLLTILRNLVSNAIKYTNYGGKVTVSVKKQIETVTFQVKDNGVGIEKDILVNLFKIGKEYTSPGTDEEKGTGLGLFICKDFIERHGGTLNIASEPGKGSVFSFTIPDITHNPG